MQTVGPLVFLAVVILSFAATPAAWAAGGEPAAAPASKLLARKSLPANQHLLITEEPFVPADDMGSLLAPSALSEPRPVKTGGFTSITVELELATGATLRLGSLSQRLWAKSDYGRFAVLDVMPLSERFVIVIQGPFGPGVLDVRLSSPLRDATLADWSGVSLGYPVQGELGATLSYDGKTESIGVEITQTIQRTKRHTVYAQNGHDFEFDRIKSWEERLPATQPAPTDRKPR